MNYSDKYPDTYHIRSLDSDLDLIVQQVLSRMREYSVLVHICLNTFKGIINVLAYEALS